MSRPLLTHVGACRRVAAYFLKQKWCGLAVTEIAGRTTGEPFAWPAPGNVTTDTWRRARAHDAHWTRGGGVLDVLALSGWDAQSPRIVVAEVKVSLSDLRADQRAEKMRRYQPQATACYLAVTEGVVDPGELPGRDARILDAVQPFDGWGVLWVPRNSEPRVLRRPGPHPAAAAPTEDLMLRLWRQAARSLAYKAVNDPRGMFAEPPAQPERHPDDWFPAGVDP